MRLAAEGHHPGGRRILSHLRARQWHTEPSSRRWSCRSCAPSKRIPKLGGLVYVNPTRVRTVRPNGDKSVIEFDDIHAVGVFPPIKNVVEMLNEKMNE